MNVAVIGLGKLGLATAVELARRHRVAGYDVDPSIMRAVLENRCPYPEPGLSEALRERLGVSLWLTDELDAVMHDVDVVAIIVPTPSTPERPAFDASYVQTVLDDLVEPLQERLRCESTPITLVVVSTVMPGTCAGFIERLEARLGAPHGNRWQLVYSPEFVALGSVLHDLEHADFYLVGHSTPEDVVETVMRRFYGSDNLRCMSHVEAELAKLLLNVALTMKVSVANLAGFVCRRHAADPRPVLDAIGSDSRIGHKYLRCSRLGFGGPCFPRDVRALQSLLSPVVRLPQSDINRALLAEAIGGVSRPGKIAVLGVGYKPGTPVVDESQAVELIKHLLFYGREVVWWDPLVQAVEGLPPRSPGLEAAIDGAALIVLATDDSWWEPLRGRGDLPLFDCW